MSFVVQTSSLHEQAFGRGEFFALRENRAPSAGGAPSKILLPVLFRFARTPNEIQIPDPYAYEDGNDTIIKALNEGQASQHAFSYTFTVGQAGGRRRRRRARKTKEAKRSRSARRA